MQYTLRANYQHGPNKFFRNRLLTASSDDIKNIMKEMEADVKTIREQSMKLAWYMRGGITYDQVLMLSSAEREIIGELAKENIETTKKSGLPWF